LLHFAGAPPRRAIPGVLHLNRVWTPPPLVSSAHPLPRPAPSPPEPDRLLHAGAAARLLHPRPADPWPKDPGPPDPGRQRPLRLLCTGSFKYSPAVDGCTRRRGGATAATRPEAAPSPPATGGEVEARGRRQPRSGDLLQPWSPPSSSPSFPVRLYLFLVGRGGRDGGEHRMRRRRLIFFLVGSKARESAAKLRRWRGRQLP
jgi:hypothetical protein